VREFKQKRPDVAVVQLGAKTSISIPGVDENLVSATSLAQAAAILKRAIFHVDNEGGLVHVAACLGTRSIVLFGPTSVKFFGYPGNINVSSDVCGDCWWATNTWMDRCPRGYRQPKCLLDLDPARIAEIAAAEVERITSGPESGKDTDVFRSPFIVGA
jgi:ADP-heptose:LPS heptosyltransferase